LSIKIPTIVRCSDSGGRKALGGITDFGTADTPFLVVYMRDPEGNVVELEQRSGEIQSSFLA
jgi:hypothetical protein